MIKINKYKITYKFLISSKMNNKKMLKFRISYKIIQIYLQIRQISQIRVN